MGTIERIYAEKSTEDLEAAAHSIRVARKIIRLDGWTQYAPARTKSGKIVQPHESSADSFSVYGALRISVDNRIEIYDMTTLAIAHVASEKLRRPVWIGLWNDGFCGSVMEAVNVLDDAIIVIQSFIRERESAIDADRSAG